MKKRIFALLLTILLMVEALPVTVLSDTLETVSSDPIQGSQYMDVVFTADDAPFSHTLVQVGQTIGALPQAPQRDGCSFAGWQDQNGQPVGADTPVVGNMMISPAYQPNPGFKAEGLFDDGAVRVTITVPDGALPENTFPRARAASADGVRSAAESMLNMEVTQAVAMDISFFNYDTRQEVEPFLPVTVNISGYGLAEAPAYAVVHMAEGGGPEIVATSESSSFQFDSANFSVYGIIGGDYKDEDVKKYVRRTYQFYAGVPGTDINTWTKVDERVFRDGDPLTLPPDPAGDDHHAFEGWYVVDSNDNYTAEKLELPATVSIDVPYAPQNNPNPPQDETIKVYAKFKDVYRVTCYIDDTKTTVFATLLGEDEENVALPTEDEVKNSETLLLENGHAFVGWKLAGDDTNTRIDAVTINGGDVEVVPMLEEVKIVKFATNPMNIPGVMALDIPDQHVAHGGKATAPVELTVGQVYSGYRLEGWYKKIEKIDENTFQYSDPPWNFDDTVEEHLLLNAKWSPVQVPYTVIIMQEMQNKPAQTTTADYSPWMTYQSKGLPGDPIDISAILDFINRKKDSTNGGKNLESTWHFHLSGTGNTDSASDPWAIQVEQNGVHVAQYNAATGVWENQDQAVVASDGQTTVRVYMQRNTYTLRVYYRSGYCVRKDAPNPWDPNGYGGYELRPSYYQYLPNQDPTYADLSGQVFTIRFRDNMHTMVYLKSVVIQKLMDGLWEFTKYYGEWGGQTRIDFTNTTYNLLPSVKAADGDTFYLGVSYAASQIEHPFHFIYYKPDGTENEALSHIKFVPYAHYYHSHSFNLGLIGNGYQIVELATPKQSITYPEYSGSRSLTFEYDWSTGKALPFEIIYKPVPYTVTFQPNDGNPSIQAKNTAWTSVAGIDEKAFYVGDDISYLLNAAPLNAARYQIGYTEYQNNILKRFDGWFDNAGFQGDPFTFDAQTMPAKNLTFYGKWTPVTAEVVFHPQNNIDQDTVQQVIIGGNVARIANPKPNPGADEMIFDGWSTNTDGTDSFDFNIPFTQDMLANSADGKYHLYAKWNSTVPYAIVYDANGGIFTDALKAQLDADNKDTKTYYAGGKAPVKGVAEKTGEVFVGWSIGGTLIADGSFDVSKHFDIADGKPADHVIELVAQYKKEELTTSVIYHANYPGGSDVVVTKVEPMAVNGKFTLANVNGIGFSDVNDSIYTSGGKRYRFVAWTNTAGEQIFSDHTGREYFYSDQAPKEKAAAGPTDNHLYAVWVELVDITVAKVWDDGNNQDGKRPTIITVKLLANGTEINTAELKAETGWRSVTFTDLPKTSGGTVIKYTVTEDEVPEYQTNVVHTEQSNQYTFTITNSYTPDETHVRVEKQWDDDNNRDGMRSARVIIRLVADGVDTGKTLVLDAANNWTGTFDHLPLKDNGKQITYTVTEDPVPHYITQIANPTHNVYIVTNRYTPGLMSIAVNKVWNDKNNQDGNRPDHIIVRLHANGREVAVAKLTAADGWSTDFINLHKYRDGAEIQYTVTEDALDHYQTQVTHNNKANFTITNSYTPGETHVRVEKQWDDGLNRDGMRPASVTIRLLANGVLTGDTLVLSPANRWTGTFDHLPLMAGDKTIAYTVEEDAVAGYQTQVTGDARRGFIVKNVHVPETRSITISKVWDDADDQDGKRPDSITVRLHADGIEVQDAVITSATGWRHTFADLPKYSAGQPIVYTVTEDVIDEYLTHVVHNADGTVFTITNSYTRGETHVRVSKIWNDNHNQDGLRPASVTVHLLANGADTGKTLTLSDANRWTGIFDDLDLMDGDKHIQYSVSEDPVDGYESQLLGNMHIGFILENIHIPSLLDLRVRKVWDDQNNAYGKRPASITVRLHADGLEVDSAELSEANGWTDTFSDLPEYSGSTPIAYTITEDEVKEYTASVSRNADNEYVITNTYPIYIPYVPTATPVPPVHPNTPTTPTPHVPPLVEIDDYGTPMGFGYVHNHVGDCFD